MNNEFNDPFTNMSNNSNIKGNVTNKKLKIALIVCVSVIIFLFFYIIIIKSIKNNCDVNIESKENLEEVSLELKDFIINNHLNSMDLYGDNLLKVAINDVCYGVLSCNEISSNVVSDYIRRVFDKDILLEDVTSDGENRVLYKYDSAHNKFVNSADKSYHSIFSEPVLMKINSIKKKNDNYILVLNKLYFDSTVSEYITTDPLGINYIYKFEDYDKPDSSGNLVLDMDKLEASYEDNYGRLKNKGTKYKYTFLKHGTSYVLQKYEVLDDNA